MIRKIGFLLVICSVCIWTASAQLIINEASNRNGSTDMDDFGEYEDWIEIYNSADSTISLEGWTLTDRKNKPDKWAFSGTIDAQETKLFYASGKGISTEDQTYWRSPVLPDDQFKYKVATSTTSRDWRSADFDDSGWDEGKAGFGYDDGDDETIVPNGTVAVYVRKTVNVEDPTEIKQILCHVDYDDGFVAYLNGQEICRSNVNGSPPEWNTLAAGNHSALIEGSQTVPEEFVVNLENLESLLITGENVFAIEVHNVSSTSSDMTLIPYLSFGYENDSFFFNKSPSWLAGNTLNHTSFKLSPEGETVYLFQNEVLHDSLLVSDLLPNHSVGRSGDGGTDRVFFSEPTPGESNRLSAGTFTEYAPAPTFDTPPGFYSGTISISLSAGDRGTIRYTTDGSEPDENSTAMTSRISISQTQTIKAKLFVNGKNASFTSVASYFIGESVSLPVLSVSLSPEDLEGVDGIFTNWRTDGLDVPAYFEYFDENQELVLSQRAAMQVDGGAGGSRSQPQHSFRLEPGDGIYGDGPARYPLIPDKPERETYESFYLRNGSNQYLRLPYKDAAFVKMMAKNTYNHYAAYRPVVTFINGEYFGVYEMREKINEDFLRSNYDLDTDNLQLLGVSYFKSPETLLAIEGSVSTYNADYARFLTFDPEDENFLRDAGDIYDLDNYTDYIIANIWSANEDWPQNNIKVFKCDGTDGRWQFASIDFDFCLNGNSGGLSSQASDNFFNYLEGKGRNYSYTNIWFQLIQNEQYKNQFINRITELMNTNYRFEVMDTVEQKMYDEVLPEMERYFEKWGSSISSFNSNRDQFRSQLKLRNNYLTRHISDYFGLAGQYEIATEVSPEGAGFIKLNDQIQDASNATTYFADMPVALEAVAVQGYRFVGWETVGVQPDSDEAVTSITLVNSDVTLRAKFAINFPKHTGVKITEVNYKSSEHFPTTDWFELYNRHLDPVNLDGWYFTDSEEEHVYHFSGGQILKSEERLIVTRDRAVFRSVYPYIDQVVGDFDFGLGSTDQINLYDNEGFLISSLHYSDELPWPLANDDSGRTLELTDIDLEPNDPSSWAIGCVGGSPGAVYDPCVTLSHEEVIGLNIFPNPVTDRTAHIQLGSSGQKMVKISLLGLDGKVIFQTETKAKQTITLNFPKEVVSGLYILRLSSAKMDISKKIIVR